MHRFFCLLCVCLCLAAGSVSAETDDATTSHPIDIRIAGFEKEDPSTHGLIRAYTTGLELWDQELNRVYQELIKTLGTDKIAVKALKESQREWIRFRDREIQWISVLFGKKDGSMFRPMSAYAIMDLTRQRAMKLADRLRILTEM